MPLLLAAAGVALLPACSSSSTPPAEMPDDDDDIVVGPEDPPMVIPVTGSEMFPLDTDDDDRPGLIVTGLDGMDPEDLVSPWLVNTSMFRLDSRTPGTGDGYVNLLQYSDDFSLANHVDFYEMQLDSCDIDDPDAPQPIGGGGDGDGPPPYISGGSSVVINTPSGPWFTYNAEIEPETGETRYRTDNELPSALPAGATLSIPGDAFPTVAAHPLYEPEAPIRLLPDSDLPVTAESEYSWIPANTAAYVKINLLAYDADDDDFKGFYVTCYLNDDGEFTMPGAVVNYLNTTEYRMVSRYSRVYQRLDFANGIVIRQDNEVAE